MTATTPDPQLVREFCDDMAAHTADAATVTTVRKALIAESYEHHKAARQYSPKLRAGQNPTQADFDAFEGRAAAAAYSYLLAAILREAPSRMGEQAASDLASLIDAVQQDGTQAIEDANDDLDEQVRGAVAS